MSGRPDRPTSTDGVAYAHDLAERQQAWWKRIVPVQLPYRWHMRRLRLGRTLDVGCGLGRNLRYIGEGAIGVDHNPHLVEAARRAGLRAMTPQDFGASDEAREGSFDSLLFAHVLEHAEISESTALVKAYLRYLRPGGRVVMITPQERGYAKDSTHVRFLGFEELGRMSRELGLRVERSYSFPFPRSFGRLFPYNEFVVIASRA